MDGHIQRLWNLSALSTAISCGATSVVSALLELGANASFRSLGGRTATELASALNREDALAVIKTALRSSIKGATSIFNCSIIFLLCMRSECGPRMENKCDYC